jgi:hypothetical protein
MRLSAVADRIPITGQETSLGTKLSLSRRTRSSALATPPRWERCRLAAEERA